jgi:hypothetical protein
VRDIKKERNMNGEITVKLYGNLLASHNEKTRQPNTTANAF